MNHYNEQNAEYILIPGGEYKYSVTKQKVKVPDMYFAKYPVTNRLYRRFIAGMEQGAWAELTRAQFAESLSIKAKETAGFAEYLGEDPTQWASKLRSNHDDDKCFNDDEQPVVGVTWFAATAYCHWLNELQGARGQKAEGETAFRLPTEVEWEWAASGGTREYPWGKDDPDDKRANYGENVGQTTPVGSYPDGATPEGLMDMAGNVWEWNENLFDPEKYKVARGLRGGSWGGGAGLLPCAIRGRGYPDDGYDDVGFRVVRALSRF